MDRDAELVRAIRQRDIATLRTLMFESERPTPRSGFRTEGELWDFKRDAPALGSGSAPSWASLAKDVVAFHNHRGGVVVFGIADDLGFKPVTHRLDSKLVNDRLRKYVGDLLWCEFHREFIQQDQGYLGILVIPPRSHQFLRFKADAFDDRERQLFAEGDSAVRDGDSTRILRSSEVDAFARRLVLPTLGRQYEVDEPFYRLLAPDYAQFVPRPSLLAQIEAGLRDPRVSVVSLLGIGGAGKTALATYATIQAYDAKSFPFIVSITAKDRELTSTGIAGLAPPLESFESLLDAILDVLGFPAEKKLDIKEREEVVRSLLTESHGLIVVDNLETVDDARTIRFLDELPIGVRALVTSRRSRVRVAARPIEIGPLTPEEVLRFVRSLRELPGFTHVSGLSDAEVQRIGTACDGIPLAIRWALSRSRSGAEALAAAENITKSGRRGEELLEFSFRRVFDGLTSAERRVLETLSLFSAPLPLEAVLVGARPTQSLVSDPTVLDAIDALVDDALVQRVFDPKLNDYALGLLPITRAFVAAEVAKSSKRGEEIRGRLKDYFEAADISSVDARLAIREARQGRASPETSLLDLAIGAENRGDLKTAEDLYRQALARNPRSWQVSRRFAEFQRHKNKDMSEALALYEQAACNAPNRGEHRALIYREWGILLRDSGRPDATSRAIECLQACLAETPNDEIASHVLATMLIREGAYRQAIALLEPMVTSSKPRSREAAVKTLLQAYDRTGDRLKYVELKTRAPALGVNLSY